MTGPEQGQRASVRIEQEDLLGSQSEPPRQCVDNVSNKEAQPNLANLLATRHRGDGEPHSVVDPREDLRLVLEVVEGSEPFASESFSEEGGGGRVGRQPRRRDDPGPTRWSDRGAEVFGEDAIGVDVSDKTEQDPHPTPFDALDNEATVMRALK